MIKYYCDICGKEITENRVKATISCHIIPTYAHQADMYLHKDCLVDFIGKDRIAKMQAEADERKRVVEARRSERMKKESEQHG